MSAVIVCHGVRQARHDHVKSFRPNGMKWAEARGMHLPDVMAAAEHEFRVGHGYAPLQEQVVMEVIGTTSQWTVIYMHLPG